VASILIFLCTGASFLGQLNTPRSLSPPRNFSHCVLAGGGVEVPQVELWTGRALPFGSATKGGSFVLSTR